MVGSDGGSELLLGVHFLESTILDERYFMEFNGRYDVLQNFPEGIVVIFLH